MPLLAWIVLIAVFVLVGGVGLVVSLLAKTVDIAASGFWGFLFVVGLVVLIVWLVRGRRV